MTSLNMAFAAGSCQLQGLNVSQAPLYDLHGFISNRGQCYRLFLGSLLVRIPIQLSWLEKIVTVMGSSLTEISQT